MEKIRANKQVWKLAEWLHENCFSNGPYHKISWKIMKGTPNYEQALNEWYDKAKTLFYMFAYDAFRGGDDGGD